MASFELLSQMSQNETREDKKIVEPTEQEHEAMSKKSFKKIQRRNITKSYSSMEIAFKIFAKNMCMRYRYSTYIYYIDI